MLKLSLDTVSMYVEIAVHANMARKYDSRFFPDAQALYVVIFGRFCWRQEYIKCRCQAVTSSWWAG